MKKRILSACMALVMLLTLFAGASAKAAETYVSTIEDSVTTSTNEFFKIQFSDGWYGESGYANLFSGGDDHYSPAADAWYEVKFIGHQVEIIASLNPNHGVYNVYIDGEKVGEADSTTTGAVTHQQVIFTSEVLEEGEHTLKVDKKSGANIQVDCVRIHHEAIAPEKIAFTEESIRLEMGSQKQAEVTITPSYASVDAISWSSADEAVAAVDETGLITAMGEGETEITAALEGTDLLETLKVKVIPAVEFLSASVGDTSRLETQEDYEELKGLGIESFSDIAWKGDTLSSKIVVASRDQEVHNVEVTVSDFISADTVISSENAEAKWLKEVLANIGRGNGAAPVKSFPDVIHTGGAKDLAEEEVGFSWISIHIPEDAKAGTYTGTVTVSADELDQPYVFDYTFEVLDVVQPTAAEVGTQIQVWQHPFSVANYYGVAEEDYFTEEHFKYMRASMIEYKELGGEDIVANIVEEAWNHQSYYSDPSMVKWTKNTDGTFSFDYTWYDAWIEFLIECGVLDPENGIGQIKCYSIVPWNNQIAYYDAASGSTVKKSYTPGAADWEEIWTIFLTDFMAHSKEKGWFDITYISMDERGMDQLQPAVELLSTLTDAEGDSFMISSAFNYSAQTDNTFMDKIDDISVNLGNVSNTTDKMRDTATHRKENGLMTTVYTCTGNYPGNFTISDPADNNWVMWFSLAHNTDGFMRWAWDNWVADPLTNVTYKYWEPGDGWFIYPAEKDAEDHETYFYSTPRYEMLKQGVRDINKAKYLMAQSEELNAEITELVESLQQPRQGGNGYGSATAASEADRELVFTETARMRNGILEIAEELYKAEAPEVPDPEPEPEPVENPFEDVTEADYFYNAVLWAVENKVTAGRTPTEFGPWANCTRGEIVTFLWRSMGSPEASVTEHQFTDVSEDFYTDAMLWAVEQGITQGKTATAFAPYDTCTRGEIVTFIWRAMGKPEAVDQTHSFTDVSEDFYTDAMLWAVENKITEGITPTTFGPYNTVMRAETVTFLYRANK